MMEKSKNLVCYGANLDVKNHHIKGEEECGPVETGMKGTAVREEMAHMPQVPFRME